PYGAGPRLGANKEPKDRKLTSAMTLKDDETTCIATPNFGGFVPSLKYQFALTYGNATRHILRTDPSLKQGHIQQELTRRREARQKAERASATIAAVPSPSQSAGSPSTSTDTIWKKSNKYATGDDRIYRSVLDAIIMSLDLTSIFG
ncbi:hypothetical protein HK405_004761, partial [Cladochytrium tenue]